MSDSDMVEQVTYIGCNVSETTRKVKSQFHEFPFFIRINPSDVFISHLNLLTIQRALQWRNLLQVPKQDTILKKKKPSAYKYTLEWKTYAMDYVTGSSMSLFPKASRRKSSSTHADKAFCRNRCFQKSWKRDHRLGHTLFSQQGSIGNKEGKAYCAQCPYSTSFL